MILVSKSSFYQNYCFVLFDLKHIEKKLEKIETICLFSLIVEIKNVTQNKDLENLKIKQIK